MNERRSQPASGDELSDERIIAIKKSSRCADPAKQWGDSLAFARAVIAADRAARPAPDGEPAHERDRDWILAIGHALGLDSGYRVPIVPSPDEFKRLFAEVARPATGVPAGYWLAPMEPDEAMMVDAHEGDREYTLRVFGDVMTVMQGPWDHWIAMRDSWLSRHPSPNGEDREVERDTERLDWLENNPHSGLRIEFEGAVIGYSIASWDDRLLGSGMTIREAIDAARAAGGEEQK